MALEQLSAVQRADTAPPDKPGPPGPRKRRRGRRFRRSWQLYVLLIPPAIYAILFLYAPLYGLQIAFKNFSVAQGINGSPWAGLTYVRQFLNSYEFWTVVKNTLWLNAYQLIALFPLPIILAIMLNTVRSRRYSRGVQMITYAPHFISTVVVVGLVVMLASPDGGIINQAISAFGGNKQDFLSETWFRHTYVWSGAWQTLGFSAIIYLAALAGVDPQLHEAATVDGASMVKRIWHIDLPGIRPVMITIMILNMGSMLTVGFEKVLLLQNPLNLSVSEVIDTYSYRVAFVSSLPQYSYAAAIALFQSVMGLVLLVLANFLARRVAKESLF